MAARDKYEVKIKCEDCGETGVIGISEDDYPFMKKLHREVDYVNGNFSSKMKDDFEVSSVCQKCGKEIISFDRSKMFKK